MDMRLTLVLLLVCASVEVLGRKKGRKNKRKGQRKFPIPYTWMHYNSNYDPTVEENGCVDIRPQCPKWARFPGYCGYSRSYMTRHCKKSCRLCKAEDEVSIGKSSGAGNSDVQEVCEDRLEDCQTYIKSQSQCELFSGLMKKYCRKTCGFCCLDILPDCSLFIKKPSQCRGLNGFFRKYCPNSCQMCGFLLPTKKPGCQDELDDCKAFTLEQCQIHKSFCSKYCAKTCGFCEEQGYSPPGTTQSVVHEQNTYGPTSKEITQENSPSTDHTPQEVTRIFQDAVNTQRTTGETNQQGISPAVTTTSPADSGISSESTQIPHKATTLPDSKKDVSVTTDSENERTTISDEIPQTTASSRTTKSINIVHTTTSKLSTRVEETTRKFPNATSLLGVKTESAETTDFTETDSSAQFTTLPTESTDISTSETTEASLSSAKITTAQALEEDTTKNSSENIVIVTSYSTDSLATSAPSSKTETGFPSTSEGTVTESPSLAQASSPKVQSSEITSGSETTSSPETTRIPEEITTDYISTVKSTSVVKQGSAKETTAPGVLDRIPTANIAKSTGNLNTDASSPRPRVTTDISSTARLDSYLSSPSTIKLVPDVFSPTTESTNEPNLNPRSNSEASSTSKPKTDIEVTTSGKVTEAQTSAEKSTAEHSATASTPEVPSTERSSEVTENQDVVVDGFGQYIPTTVPLDTREQKIDAAVVPTTKVLSTIRSALRSKIKKPVCVDKLKECTSYVKENINYCKYHVHFMHEYCSKSCGFCGTAEPPTHSPGHDNAFIPKCEDERKKKCAYFSRFVGYCTINEKYMRKRCPKSCGFCGVAPGSAPMDKTFVRNDQTYELSIMTKWDGTPIKHAPIKFKLSAEDNTNVRLEVSGPLFNQPGPPPCAAGQPCWQLWNYEVAEMFFLGEKEKYLELEVSPHGPHLLLLLDGIRKPFKTKLPMRYSANKDLSSMTWNGTAIIPLDYFPPGMRKINAYAIHGPNNNKIYESLYPASKTAYPDFHRLDFFKDFDFKSMFPSGWNQPISPLWLRSK